MSVLKSSWRLIARSYSSKKIPTPTHLPVFGTALSLMASGGASKLHLYVDRRHKELGGVFKERLGNVEAVFVADAEYMRMVFSKEGRYPVHVLPEAWMVYNEMYGCSRGLFFMDGEDWLKNRKVMNKLLMKGDLGYIDEGCSYTAKGLVDRLSGEIVNLEGELYRWSLETVISILLGTDTLKANKDIIDIKIKELAAIIHLVFHTSAKLQFIPAKFASRWKIKSWQNFENSVQDTLKTTNQLVKAFIEQYPNNSGLLGMMLNEPHITPEDIKKIIVDLILAAGDTTAYTMEWILYQISKYPELQKTTSETLLKNCIRETLRLYPVAPFLTRILPEDINLGPFNIPKSTLIIFSSYTSGRNPAYFSNPEEFNPNRWLQKKPIMSLASLPFAMGSRSCIGRKIAETQLYRGLEQILKNYEVKDNSKEDIEIMLKLIAVPSKPIDLKFVRKCIN